MSGIQFNKCAITMGKVLKMFEEEPQFNSAYDCEQNIEGLLVIAYACRVGILDRTDQYPSWIMNNLTIRIPTGIFSHKKTRMNEALEMTIGKLIHVSSFDSEISNMIEGVLSRGETFYEFEKIIPFKLKQKLNK